MTIIGRQQRPPILSTHPGGEVLDFLSGHKNPLSTGLCLRLLHHRLLLLPHSSTSIKGFRQAKDRTFASSSMCVTLTIGDPNCLFVHFIVLHGFCPLIIMYACSLYVFIIDPRQGFGYGLDLVNVLTGREPVDQSIIPGLPDDLALRCLARLSHGYHGLMESVCKRWRDLIRSSDYACYKARLGWSGDWLFVLTEQSDNQWIAYDPEADRWRPLPRAGDYAGFQHYGFSCVCVHNRFLVIGGYYAPNDSSVSVQKPTATDCVLQFDPFKKQWTSVARMRTARSHFACCVIDGKVFVAGGRNVSSSRGLALAEVYDPLTDKWEELPTMHEPQMDCVGLSYKGKFHVLSDQVGLSEMNSSQVFDPLEGTWCTVDDSWPFSRAMQFAVEVMGDGRVYSVVDWGESLIKTRDSGNGEWRDIGSVPSVVLPDHTRALEAFSYGFASLRDELYVLGGKVLKWEEAGAGRFDIVRLPLVRVCNPVITPLNWKQARPLCGAAGGSILGCASLEDKHS